MIKKYSELQQEPTQEMLDWFKTRTSYHVNLVNKIANALHPSFPDIPIDHIQRHDANKLYEPILTPYIYLTWKYKVPTYEYPPGIADRISRATLLHVTTSGHHPECWDKEHAQLNLDDSRTDRDQPPGYLISACRMPDRYLFEMCCDWASVSKERDQKSPRDWADRNIGVRWEFTPEQKKLIYSIIDNIGAL